MALARMPVQKSAGKRLKSTRKSAETCGNAAKHRLGRLEGWRLGQLRCPAQSGWEARGRLAHRMEERWIGGHAESTFEGKNGTTTCGDYSVAWLKLRKIGCKTN